MVNFDVVVVLGAAVTPEAKATPCLLRRTLSGCDYAREYGAALLCCGGKTSRHHEVSEASVMAEIALKQGIEAHSVYLEDKSRNTLENALFAKEMMSAKQWNNIIVVTDRSHLLRARLVFRVLGVKAQFRVAHIGPRLFRHEIFSYLYEVPALLWYGVRILRGHHKTI
ncbi:YdcF family protein [Terasakiella sp. SH-1]|uniref:YdcF family protein n=1 Tax=Terasakiella sp. SH-1 TaxID=2560057 RepID=UPI001073FEFC|nr:YdcF family protein [Terasakiella sp. SH-1]